MKSAEFPSGMRRMHFILSLLAGFFLASSPAAPIPLPDWVKPMESSLPPVSPELVAEVDDILAFRDLNLERRHQPGIAEQLIQKACRLAELQDQGDQALIWQYLKATTDFNYPVMPFLMRYQGDRALAAWLLPVIRFRMEWLETALYDGASKKQSGWAVQGSELPDIERYLCSQGEFSDLEKLNRLVQAAAKAGFKSSYYLEMKKWPKYHWLQLQIKAMQDARDQIKDNSTPYWQGNARYLISEGILTEEALKPRPRNGTLDAAGRQSKPLGPRLPLPDPPGPFPPTWIVWPMWLVIFAISAGLLRWLFRKPRSPVAPSGAAR